MKKVNLLTVTVIAYSVFMVAMMVESDAKKKTSLNDGSKDKLIEAYRGYVVSTEHMLDLLDHQCNWVDRLDHDGYYESRAEIFHLDSIALSHEQARQEACFKMNEKFNQ